MKRPTQEELYHETQSNYLAFLEYRRAVSCRIIAICVALLLAIALTVNIIRQLGGFQ